MSTPESIADTPELSVADALRDATDICLARDPAVFVLGEGVADPKGIFGTTSGLVQKYGAERVMEMPISENGFTGMAIGSALMGQRPVLVHQRVDFALLSIEQIFNNAAKTHYVTLGRHTVPMVIRMIIGRGWGQGPAHSQSLESVFAHIPGLKVVMPSMPADAKGMLIAAIEDDNPVVMIEHRWCHYRAGLVPADYYTSSLDGPTVVRMGRDVTLVASSYMVYEALHAAKAIAGMGIEAEVIDLRILRPLNVEPIVQSVRKTGRLVTVDTGWRTLGMGAEIVAQLVEAAFDALTKPPIRLGLADHPTPSSRALVALYYPYAGDIVRAVADQLGTDLSAIVTRLDNERAKLPVDIPNPAFRGPF